MADTDPLADPLAEVAPPPPTTAEDVIAAAFQEWQATCSHLWQPIGLHIAAALRDAGLLRVPGEVAGLLREDTP